MTQHLQVLGGIDNLVHLLNHVGIIGVEFVGHLLLFLWRGRSLDFGLSISEPDFPPFKQSQFLVV